MRDQQLKNGGIRLLDHIEIDLRGRDSVLTLHIDVDDNSLGRKWLSALNDVIRTDLHLEKNYCWMGWTESERNARYLCEQINASIDQVKEEQEESETDYFFE